MPFSVELNEDEILTSKCTRRGALNSCPSIERPIRWHSAILKYTLCCIERG